ncbi:MAG: glycosyltransferase family 2 protein [Promethearchaeota archaeon]|jgi:GT2 family glycosyltransferase
MEQNSLVSFIIATFNRKKELRESINTILKQNYSPIEIIIFDNGSTDGTFEMISKEFSEISSLNYYKSMSNLGACLGKNEGIKRAKGEFMVIMDDDAEIKDKNSVQKILNKFEKDKEIGLLHLKSVNYYTGITDRKEFPHKNKSLNPDREFETSYFVGVGHAVRKDVFNKAGLYPNFTPIWGGELDLSFRILEAGYKILYFPDVVLLHKVSPRGRVSKKKYWEKALENRIRTSIRNLPMRYVIVSSIIWTLFVLYKTGGNLLVPIKAYESVLKDLKELKRERKVLKPHTIKRIKDLNGRLFY